MIKKDYKRKLVKGSKVFLKKKKKKSDNMVLNDTIRRLYQKMKNLPEDEKQKLVEYRKRYYKMRKTPCYNYKELFFT